LIKGDCTPSRRFEPRLVEDHSSILCLAGKAWLIATCRRAKRPMRISIVGPCASGKTVLAERLQALGYDAHECAQEHSYVPTMWQRIAKPDVLIYLDASLPTIAERRSADWSEEYLAQQNLRLSHARQHCHLYIPTDGLSEEEVLQRALDFLRGAFPLSTRVGSGEGEPSIEGSTPSQPPPARGGVRCNAMNIDDYCFGRIVIDGRSYTSDVIVFPDRVNDGWWRNEGHELCPADLWEVVQEKPAVLVAGTGKSGLMKVLSETEVYLEQQGIKLIVERTAEACQTFNRLSRSGERAVAALHLTC
jgi:hypothetical protein